MIKQATVAGNLVNFTEAKKYGSHPDRRDYIALRSVLNYAAKKHSIPKFWEFNGRSTGALLRTMINDNAISKQEVNIVHSASGDFRFIHKDAIDRAITWVLKNADGAMADFYPVNRSVEDSVDASVDAICAASLPTSSPKTEEKPGDLDKGASKLVDIVYQQVRKAVAEELASEANVAMIKVGQQFASGHKKLQLDYYELKSGYDALYRENEALRKMNAEHLARIDPGVQVNAQKDSGIWGRMFSALSMKSSA